MQKPQTAIFAPLDTHCQQVTQGVITVGGITTLPALFLALSGVIRSDIAWYGAVFSAAVAAVFLIGIIAAWATMPTALELTATELRVLRRWSRPLVVPYTAIEAATAIAVGNDFAAEGWGLTAGLFGYQGLYRSQRYGRVLALATDRDKLIAIARRDGPLLVVSPLLPFASVSALREQLARKED